MDNASKALIMAGETLIGMLIVGLIVYAVTHFGEFSANMNKKITINKQMQFNSNFLKYQGRIDITADEIITAINFAKNSNDSNELYLKKDSNGYSDEDEKSPFWVDVTIKFSSSEPDYGGSVWKHINLSNYSSWRNGFLNNYNQQYFKCNVGDVKQDPANNTIVTPHHSFIKLEPVIRNTDENDFFGISDNSLGMVTKIEFEPTQVIENFDEKGNEIQFDMKYRDKFVTK